MSISCSLWCANKDLNSTQLKLFVYLNFCVSEVIDSPWTKITKDLFNNSSIQRIITFLSRVILTSKSSWANEILKSVTLKYDLQYNNINSMVLDGAVEKNTEIKSWSKVHEVSNHPVHIMRADGTKSPSAFIPFCYFGGNAEDDGLKVDGFKYPVCNMFKAKVLNCLLYTSPSPRDGLLSRMPSSA